jgi:hypothetical protein
MVNIQGTCFPEFLSVFANTFWRIYNFCSILNTVYCFCTELNTFCQCWAWRKPRATPSSNES